MASTSVDASFGNAYLFNQLDTYPRDEDEEFQGGLRAILGSMQNTEQVEHLTLRAKCYYYARKAGAQVDFDGYKRHVESQRHSAGTNGIHSAPAAPGSKAGEGAGQVEDAGAGGMANAPKPASFAEICDMIAEGKPIPGIRDIPDTVLEGQASESQAGKRKKPWEKDAGSIAGGQEEKLSWMR